VIKEDKFEKIKNGSELFSKAAASIA